MRVDVLSFYKRLGYISYRLEGTVRKEIPEGKIYVEDNMSNNWHRHVEQHGPKPEAYARYTLALIQFEEALCSK